jgi:hypothetical protein
MKSLSAADLSMIRDLRCAGVLQNMDGNKIPDNDGTIVISCADGDRISDILEFHRKQCDSHECHHPLTLNGGPLLIPRDSPVADKEHPEGPVILKHVVGANKIKNISTIVAYGHWPCGAALASGLSLYQTLELFVKSKDNIRQFLQAREIKPSVVACFHVDYGSGVKRSYFFHRKQWYEWIKKLAAA